jgi:hypothetical protein
MSRALYTAWSSRRATSSTSTGSVCSTSRGTLHLPLFSSWIADVAHSPNNDVVLSTIKESPVLAAGDFENDFERSGNPVPTMEEWTFAKQKWQRTPNMSFDDKTHQTAKILPGFKERMYT